MNNSSVIDINQLKISCGQCSLMELCLPRDLEEDEIERLDHIIRRRRPLQAGQHLYRVGDPCHSLFAVRSGSVKAYLPTDDGDEQVLGFYLPGELLGLDGFDSGQHTCSAIALETCSVCEVPLAQLEDLCDEIPGLRRQLYRLMGQEIASEQAMLLILGKRTAEERLARFLFSLSSRLQRRGFSPREFNLTMSRRDIGNYLGLAVETVSRLMASFQKDGLISVDRRNISLNDLDRLREVMGECHEAHTSSI